MFDLLVIDNNPMDGKVMAHLLAKHSDIEYIGQANNGKQGIQMIKKLQPKIVFLGVNKNEKDGNLKLIPLIKSISKGIYIVVLSMQYEFKTIQIALNYGAFNYLLKPIKINDLYALLNDISIEIKLNIDNSSGTRQYNKYENAIQLIKSSTNEKINNVANDICNDLLDSNKGNINLMIEQCKKFTTSFLYTLDINSNDKKNIHDVLVILLNAFLAKINSLESIQEIHNLLSGFIKDCNFIFNSEIQNLGFERISKAKVLIKQYVETEKSVNLEIISQEMFISPYYLSRLFKRIEGITFMDYLLNCRLDKAKLLLLTTNETIKVIAINCGYNEPNSFRRMFKKKIGVSPSDYRESQK